MRQKLLWTIGRVLLSCKGQQEEMSYYLLLSLVPILLVVANIIPLLPINTTEILSIIEQAVPGDVSELLMPIVTGYLESSSGGAISIGLLASIWSASNVFSTLRRVLDDVYGANTKKNFVIARFVILSGYACYFTCCWCCRIRICVW